MYKNIQKGLVIGTLSIVCLLQVGCGPGVVSTPGYYNNSNYTPYYAGTSGYYWGTPNNVYWNNNGYYGGGLSGYSTVNPVVYSVVNPVGLGYYGGDRDDYYRGGYGGNYGGDRR